MTTFLRLLTEPDKAAALLDACERARRHETDPRRFEVAPESFDAVPGKPFAYWVGEAVWECFKTHLPFESDYRKALGGLKTLSDERFLRGWWEVSVKSGWKPIAKGGAFSPFYSDLALVINWASQGLDISWYGYQKRPREGFGGGNRGLEAYFRPGLTWPRRTNGLSFRVMPAGCIFADKGPAIFVAEDDHRELLALSCLLNSKAFGLLVSIQLARTELAQSYEVGLIQQTPIPPLTAEQRQALATLARRAWSLKRTLDTATETSHAFVLPAALRTRLGDDDPPAIETELARIQAEIDALAFDLYGFAAADRPEANAVEAQAAAEDSEDEDDANTAADAPAADALLSWAVGVAFGRFDIRLATGEREIPQEPEPFDPLPAQSPGMLPDGATPFHDHAGFLVDDPGHPHDLARWVETVLQRVAAPLADDPRAWLRREFFPFHLQRYSKSRRKAPIYWPLATKTGSYTVWLYYPRLGRDTFFQVLDLVKNKLDHESGKLHDLQQDAGPTPNSGQRKAIEAQATLIEELSGMRDEVARIAPLWNPNLNDGVIINFAPLWRLVLQHASWQKECKATWDKLVEGDYDWSHLAMHLWPERVVPKCLKDRSLAIAHGLDAVFWKENDSGKWQPVAVDDETLQNLIAERGSPAVKAALQSLLEAPAPRAATRSRATTPRRPRTTPAIGTGGKDA